MNSGITDLRHEALVYDGLDEYVSRAVAFLREGLRRGEGAVVAHTRGGLAVVREALGDDADAVTLVDVGAVYTRPARTLAAYHAVYADQLARTPALRAVADVQFGPDPGEWDLWTAYEAVFNESFAHLPAWVVCTYDGQRLPDDIRDAVWRTHPSVATAAGSRASEHYEEPRALLRRVAPSPPPVERLRSIGFGRDVEDFRERLAGELAAAGVPERRSLDMLFAATEIAANAVHHGGGVRDVRVGHAAGRFACEIVDAGLGFDDPAAGYLAPRDGAGSGLWIARQLTWQLDFLHTPAGFTARLVL
ncbi:MAG TPA: sensor histidine kinase [Actinomycetospora sp.]|uniref:sensor histidine kinase n=1 Tax=Actinomycetospora sp. TaxID=1872135 RepID=UPI002F3EB0BA